MNPASRSVLYPLTCLLLAVFAGGCGGDTSQRKALSGTVTVDGANAKGLLSFFPTDGNQGPAASAVVIDGAYQFTTDNGPFQGAHRVVFAMENPPAAPPVVAAEEAESGAAVEPEPAELGGKQALVATPDRRRSRKTTSSNEEKTQVYGKWERKHDVPSEGNLEKDFAFRTDSP